MRVFFFFFFAAADCRCNVVLIAVKSSSCYKKQSEITTVAL